MGRKILYLQNKSENPKCCIREMKNETYTTMQDEQKIEDECVDTRTRNPREREDVSDATEALRG